MKAKRLTDQERSSLRVEQSRLHELNLYLREDIPIEAALIRHNEERIDAIEEQVTRSNRLIASILREIK